MVSRALLALAGTGVLAASAAAQPTADDAAAEALFDEAVALRNRGELAPACAKFRSSYRLAAARGTLLNIAECFEAEGKLASAWATYRTLADQAEAAGDRDRLAIARAKRAELEPRLAYVTIAVAAAPAGVEVRRDETRLPPEGLGQPTPIDAGAHTITVSAPGYHPWTGTLDVADGARQRVDVPALAPLPPPPPPPPPPPRVTQRHPRATAGLVALGVGAAGITVGLGFGIAAWRAERDADAGCDDALRCSPDGFARLNDAHAHADRADVLVVGGLALAAVGGWLWWTAPAGVEVTIGGPGAVGATVGGRF